MPRFRCTACDKSLSAPDSTAGKSVACPKCGTKVRVPSPVPEPVAAMPAGPPVVDWTGEFAPESPAGDMPPSAAGLPPHVPPVTNHRRVVPPAEVKSRWFTPPVFPPPDEKPIRRTCKYGLVKQMAGAVWAFVLVASAVGCFLFVKMVGDPEAGRYLAAALPTFGVAFVGMYVTARALDTIGDHLRLSREEKYDE